MYEIDCAIRGTILRPQIFARRFISSLYHNFQLTIIPTRIAQRDARWTIFVSAKSPDKESQTVESKDVPQNIFTRHFPRVRGLN